MSDAPAQRSAWSRPLPGQPEPWDDLEAWSRPSFESPPANAAGPAFESPPANAAGPSFAPPAAAPPTYGAQPPIAAPAEPAGPAAPTPPTTQRGLFYVLAAAIIVFVLVILVALGGTGGDGDPQPTTSTAVPTTLDDLGEINPGGPLPAPSEPELVGAVPKEVLDDAPTYGIRVFTGPTSSNTGDLYLVSWAGFDPRSAVPFARDVRLDHIGQSRTLAVSDPTLDLPSQRQAIVPLNSAVLVAWEQNEEYVVALAQVGHRDPIVILRGPQMYLTVDATHEHLLIETHGVDHERCYSAPLADDPADHRARADQLQLLAEGDHCEFGATGLAIGNELVVPGNYGGPEAHTLVDVDGTPVSKVSGPQYLYPGSRARWALSPLSIALYDVRTGKQIFAEPDESAEVVAMADGKALLYFRSGPAGKVLSVVDARHQRRDLVSSKQVAGQLLADGDTIIGASKQGHAVEIDSFSVSTGRKQVLLRGDDLEYVVVPGDVPRVLAWKTGTSNMWIGPTTAPLASHPLPSGRRIRGRFQLDPTSGDLFIGIGSGSGTHSTALLQLTANGSETFDGVDDGTVLVAGIDRLLVSERRGDEKRLFSVDHVRRIEVRHGELGDWFEPKAGDILVRAGDLTSIASTVDPATMVQDLTSGMGYPEWHPND